MSKHEVRITAAGEAPQDAEALRAALVGAAVESPGRHDAMARFLSGADGWRDARRTLRGAFAEAPRTTAGLTGKQEQ